MPDFYFNVTATMTIPAKTEPEARSKAMMVTSSLEWSLSNVVMTITDQPPPKPPEQNGLPITFNET